jgi:hypothetical protein
MHSFTIHDNVARELIIISPAGLERHFREHSIPIHGTAPLPDPDFDRIMRAVAGIGEFGVVVPATPPPPGAANAGPGGVSSPD